MLLLHFYDALLDLSGLLRLWNLFESPTISSVIRCPSSPAVRISAQHPLLDLRDDFYRHVRENRGVSFLEV